MIVKKIKNPKHAGTKSGRISGLVTYIVSPAQEGSDEKCIHAGGREFFTETTAGQIAEMVALAQDAVRSSDPVNHYVLSWREGERPSGAQVEEAVDLFLDQLGLEGHQAIYGLHDDTDNVHLHLAVNRVHPDTLKVTKINQGFDLEAAHQAIARIEHVQGWQREEHGRYAVVDGEVVKQAVPTERPRQPDQPQRDREHRTGEKSAVRIAIESGAPVIERATSWEELHQGLAAQGMRYERVGSGAKVFVGEVAVKASSVARHASLAQVQARLGPYEPPPADLPLEVRAPEWLEPESSERAAYRTERQAHYDAKRAEKVDLDRRHTEERQGLAQRHRQERSEVLQGSWVGRGPVLNAVRSVLAADQAAETLELRDQQRRERAQWRADYPPYPDLEQWHRQRGEADLAEQWRYRASPPRIEGVPGEPRSPWAQDIRDFTAEVVDDQVHYTRRGASGGGKSVAFVDRGARIEIEQWYDRSVTLAALQVASQKWGAITVTGPPAYQRMCVDLAAAHGLKLSNPELQGPLRQAREEREAQPRSRSPRRGGRGR